MWHASIVSRDAKKIVTASSSGKPVLVEVKIDIGATVEVSKIAVSTLNSSAGSSCVIACQYSEDGYTWENVPSSSYVKAGEGDFVFRFEKTLMRFVKLILSKSSPDEMVNDSPSYDFGLKCVKMFSEEFEIAEEGVSIVSELLTPKAADQLVPFCRASLEVCEEVPDETSIRYQIRAYDGSSYTSWIDISPLSRRDIGSSVVDFSAPTEWDSDDLDTVFDSTLDNNALNILRKDGAGDLSYRLSGANETICNFYIECDSSYISNPYLLRNMGYATGKFPSVTTDNLVGEVECGWGLREEGIYYCVFEIRNPLGLKVDFGETQAKIDNKTVLGITTILPGWHTFETSRGNWFTITGSTPTTEDAFRAIDPKYPFNHKLLIEGFQYPEGFSGNKIYIGADQYAQYKATRVGLLSFQNNANLDFSTFAMDQLTGPKVIVLVKFNSSYSDYANERNKLYYTRRYDDYESIQFKATLQTQNAKKTPVLSYYRIRVL
jgi:hypothetical protein